MTPQQATPIAQLVLTETAVSILVGGVPTLVAFRTAGADSLEKLLSGLIPPSTLLNYSLILTGVAFAVDWANRFFLKATDLGDAIWDRLDEITSQVATSLHAILRIAAGVLLTFLALWAVVDFQSITAQKAKYFIGYGLMALG